MPIWARRMPTATASATGMGSAGLNAAAIAPSRAPRPPGEHEGDHRGRESDRVGADRRRDVVPCHAVDRLSEGVHGEPGDQERGGERGEEPQYPRARERKRQRRPAKAGQRGVGEAVEDGRVQRDQREDRRREREPAQRLVAQVGQGDDEIGAEGSRAAEREAELVDDAGAGDALGHALALGQGHTADGQRDVRGHVAGEEREAPDGAAASRVDRGSQRAQDRHPERGMANWKATSAINESASQPGAKRHWMSATFDH